MSASKARRGGNGYPVFRNIATRWSDNDVYGHMNNVVHYSLFDTVINAWLIEQGALDLERGAQIGLVVETGCRYHKPLAFPDRIRAGIRVSRIGTTSVRYEVGLFRGGEEAPAAEGFFVHVYVDRQSRRPTPLNPSLRKALQQLQNAPSLDLVGPVPTGDAGDLSDGNTAA